jgi:hypothetical protein
MASNSSCPAVSQTMSRTSSPMDSTYVVRSRKSTPMVFLYSSVNAPRQNRRIMDDFPTAPLPTTSTLTSFSNASSICGVRGARVGGRGA